MQGEVSPEDAAKVAGDLYDMGCYEVSMGDTIGVATPASTAKLFQAGSACQPTTPDLRARDCPMMSQLEPAYCVPLY